MKTRALAVIVAVLLYLPAAEALPAPQATSHVDGPSVEFNLPAFSDTELARLVQDLDTRLSKRTGEADWSKDARASLTEFAHHLQRGLLTPTQETRVLDHLGQIGSAQPDGTALVAGPARVISALTVGKKAPEITGTDLDGKEMRLSDFRGRVVLLSFSGDWCGICRSQYRYERSLQELYRELPFAIVGVNSDPDVLSAKRGLIENGLAFRTWWDGSSLQGPGPIASAWNIDGWPTTYVIDTPDGVIRFVDLRSDDLLKAVKQVLADTPAASGRSGP